MIYEDYEDNDTFYSSNYVSDKLYFDEFEKKNKVFKISYGDLYCHLELKKVDLISIEVNNEIKKDIKENFEILVPNNADLDLLEKVWFKKEDIDELTTYFKSLNLEKEIPFCLVLLSFMLDYGFTDLVEKDSFEFQLNKINNLLSHKFSTAPPNFESSKFEVESIKITFSNVKNKVSKETVSIDKNRLDIKNKLIEQQFDKFQKTIKMSLLELVKNNLNKLQLKTTKNSRNIIITKFHDFYKTKDKGLSQVSIVKAFIFLYIQSNHDLDDKKNENLEVSYRIKLLVEKVRKWIIN